MKKKRQHFVPQFLQKNFISSSNQFLILELENSSLDYRTYRSNPSNNFLKKYFYEVTINFDNEDDKDLENHYKNLTEDALSIFEADWSKTINDFKNLLTMDLKKHSQTSLSKISQKDLESIIAFITSMYSRNPNRFLDITDSKERTSKFSEILGAQSFFRMGPKCMSDLKYLDNPSEYTPWNSKFEWVITLASNHYTEFNINVAHKQTFGFVLPEDPAIIYENDQYIMGSMPITPTIQIQFLIDRYRPSNRNGIIPRINYLSKGITKKQQLFHVIHDGHKYIVQDELHAKQIYNSIKQSQK